MTNEEKSLLEKLAAGLLDGCVGNDFTTSGGSTVWMVIKNGNPIRYKQGPGRRVFNGKENEVIDGALKVLQKWVTDDEKIAFLRKFGYLMKDEAVKLYSAKFKPTK